MMGGGSEDGFENKPKQDKAAQGSTNKYVITPQCNGMFNR
jgi:hypothetical protein